MSVTDKQEQIAENQRMIFGAVYAQGFEDGKSHEGRAAESSI